MLITYILHKFRDTAWMKEKCLISDWGSAHGSEA